jgi:hypothetical protein
MARLWRVAHFVLSDVLTLPLEEVLRFKGNSRLARTGSTASYESLMDQSRNVAGTPKTTGGVRFSPAANANSGRAAGPIT